MLSLIFSANGHFAIIDGEVHLIPFPYLYNLGTPDHISLNNAQTTDELMRSIVSGDSGALAFNMAGASRFNKLLSLRYNSISRIPAENVQAFDYARESVAGILFRNTPGAIELFSYIGKPKISMRELRDESVLAGTIHTLTKDLKSQDNQSRPSASFEYVPMTFYFDTDLKAMAPAPHKFYSSAVDVKDVGKVFNKRLPRTTMEAIFLSDHKIKDLRLAAHESMGISGLVPAKTAKLVYTTAYSLSPGGPRDPQEWLKEFFKS